MYIKLIEFPCLPIFEQINAIYLSVYNSLSNIPCEPGIMLCHLAGMCVCVYACVFVCVCMCLCMCVGRGWGGGTQACVHRYVCIYVQSITQ